MYVWWSECGLGFGSDADNFELKNINVRVCVATLVVLWVRDGWSSTHMLRWLARFLTGPGTGGMVNGGFLKRFLSGLQPDTTGGIFVRACMQSGNTAFDYAKTRGHGDIAVRDRG